MLLNEDPGRGKCQDTMHVWGGVGGGIPHPAAEPTVWLVDQK